MRKCSSVFRVSRPASAQLCVGGPGCAQPHKPALHTASHDHTKIMPMTPRSKVWLCYFQSVLKAAKSECSSVESFADFWRSPCILPAAEKTRSTPADEAGAAKYCFTIFASAGHSFSLPFHHLSKLIFRSVTSLSAR